MSIPPEDSPRTVVAIIHLVQGVTLLWRAPGVVRARAVLTALHVAPLGLAYQHFDPGEHNVAVIAVYTTLLLLMTAVRGGPPPAPGHLQDYPYPTPA